MTLRDLEAGDLFDVLHVLYEEDITPKWEQHIDVKDRVREALYQVLYGRQYKYSTTKKSRNPAEGFDPESDLPPPEDFGGSREVKPYIPVSSEADLMKVLDAPMN